MVLFFKTLCFAEQSMRGGSKNFIPTNSVTLKPRDRYSLRRLKMRSTIDRQKSTIYRIRAGDSTIFWIHATVTWYYLKAQYVYLYRKLASVPRLLSSWLKSDGPDSAKFNLKQHASDGQLRPTHLYLWCNSVTLNACETSSHRSCSIDIYFFIFIYGM